MSARGCEHFERYKSNPKNMDSLKWTHMVFVVGNSCEAKALKICNVYCRACKKRGPSMHVCLDCYYFGCRNHMREHTAVEGHLFSMDLSYGQLHCTPCGDYIYDAAFDAIAWKNKMRAGRFKKRLFDCTSWDPTDEERQLLAHRTERICIGPDSMMGLRGLVNMGSTCYLNCIVQALIHTPPLRDYFLAERHKCKGVSGDDGSKLAYVSQLFQEFYKGSTIPLALPDLLNLTWSEAPHLAGCVQQDAHEFFIAILNVLHKHCSETVVKPTPINACPCIIHQIFTGHLQSDVVCQNCNGVSTKIELSWDFSLDLGPVTLNGRPPCSLADCLERFTSVEHLGKREKIFCENCGSNQESTKQFTMKMLPIVAIFHLKRFEHLENGGRKITTSISFPEMLDLTPFMSRRKNRTAFPFDNRYSLFAVVNHCGSNFSGGHYTAFVRQQQDYWYQCDDTFVTRAKLNEVLNSEGYILFYHKHVLEYE
ncbi:ubiquitin carboxyl-terminal hydrolase nonstop [Cylas formicarius]|uniref:ubiquitin carboxyl-terminal hydrolase nonstop n=1 Tax=Cylas formicarius TaxID=197179 RepID=UPI0029586823|nr:ubiquitin carboxyl-terminal hydrolase nonstop [Cylas formicarius]